MQVFQALELMNILPELFVSVTALLLLMFGVYTERDRFFTVASISMLAILVAMAMILFIGSVSPVSFYNTFLVNDFTQFVKLLLLLAVLVNIFMSVGYYRSLPKHMRFEFPIFMSLALVGMMVMVSANSLLVLYMGLELQSLSLYVLAAFHRDVEKSSEAGLKYFVLGALSSGLLLYGCSLIYGFTGSLHFDEMSTYIRGDATLSLGFLTGLVFVLVGVFFKISAVPFHMWTPDVYEGAPTPVTAFFSVAPKIAAFAILIRILIGPFLTTLDQWQQIVVFVSVLSMVIGSLGAIRQTNIKRLMAYSSISHVGFALMGIAAGTYKGISGTLFYMAIYFVMNAGVFAIIMMIKHRENLSEDLVSLSGFSKSHPLIALGLAILMLSMAGIPPMAGFFGKFMVVLAAVDSGLYVLAVIGVLSSVIAAFYYLRIIKIMYFDEATYSIDENIPFEIRLVASASVIANTFFVLGINPLIAITSSAVVTLFK